MEDSPDQDASTGFFSFIDAQFLTLLTAGACCFFAVRICLNLIGEHLNTWRKPREQKAVIAIICMVPIFAVSSYVGLAEMPHLEVVSTILDSIKECYEAFVIASFLELMYCYLGVSTDSKTAKPIPDEIKGRELHHSWPLTMFVPHVQKVDARVLDQLHAWTWQFVVIRPVFSLAIVGLEALDLYKGPVTWLFSIVFNSSVFLAMYTLLLFYHAFDKELAPHQPLAKFLCIKGVVFFAYWQGLVVSILASTGVIHQGQLPFSVKQIEEAIQNFLVCVEMLVFAHFYTKSFSAKEYGTPTRVPAQASAAAPEAKKEL